FAALLDDEREQRTKLALERSEGNKEQSLYGGHGGAAPPAEARGSKIEDGRSPEIDPRSSILDPQSAARPFRPAVAIQQIFSLIKQSPTAAVRLAELSSLFAGMLTADDLRAILGALQLRSYLRAGRPGEWRAGDRLNELFDQQTGAQPGLSVYS